MSKLTPRQVLGITIGLAALVGFIFLLLSSPMDLLILFAIILGVAGYIYIIAALTINRWDWWND